MATVSQLHSLSPCSIGLQTFVTALACAALVETLQTRPLKPSWNRRPANQHHYLENATTALKRHREERHQAGEYWQYWSSKFPPPRKLCSPGCKRHCPSAKSPNLTTDWNSGVNLAACWTIQSVQNCTNAMNLAQSELVWRVCWNRRIWPHHGWDELSGMTYLSYFMKPGGPGYNATMRWTDWNDGRVMCEIIKGLGGPAPCTEKLSTDPFHYEKYT
ncbi:unnamed protein product [Ceratitis capitata]|uniref:(Mediterranean fruit fly) hypothetical protein n=1 Tax=Ceratitis capitata TaxID=7213 RepID=A0A811VM88_CERCA|nr:unnamed protein product [Ceratitis capitata]